MADDDVKTLLRQVLDFLPTLATKADVAAVEARMSAKIDATEARLSAKIETEARVVAARLDEQRQTINAMIPKQLAALPPRSAAG